MQCGTQCLSQVSYFIICFKNYMPFADIIFLKQFYDFDLESAL